MKKILSAIMALTLLTMLVFTMASCGNGEAKKAKVINIPLSEEEYAFCVAKDNTELLSKVNEYLKKIKEDGTFDKICNNYFGDGTPKGVTSAKEDSSKDQLVVATSTGFEPFEMVENGVYTGIDMEIAAGLAEYLGKELVIKDMDFPAVTTSVQLGQTDIGMAGLTITPAREEVLAFSDTYYNAGQVLIVKESNTEFDNCKTKEDVENILKSKTKSTKIGCQEGTTGCAYVKGDKDDPDGFGFEGLPVTLKEYTYGALAITAMLNGDVDYVILDNAPANAIVKSINKD